MRHDVAGMRGCVGEGSSTVRADELDKLLSQLLTNSKRPADAAHAAGVNNLKRDSGSKGRGRLQRI